MHVNRSAGPKSSVRVHIWSRQNSKLDCIVMVDQSNSSLGQDTEM